MGLCKVSYYSDLHGCTYLAPESRGSCYLTLPMIGTFYSAVSIPREPPELEYLLFTTRRFCSSCSSCSSLHRLHPNVRHSFITNFLPSIRTFAASLVSRLREQRVLYPCMCSSYLSTPLIPEHVASPPSSIAPSSLYDFFIKLMFGRP